MSTSRSQSLNYYWRNKVVFPAVALASILLIGAGTFAHTKVKKSQQDTLRISLDTMAALISEPLIVGDEFEAIRRIGVVGNAMGLNIWLTDHTQTVIAKYPANIVALDLSLPSLAKQIIRDNRLLGEIRAQNRENIWNFDSLTLAVLSGAIFASLGTALLLRANRKIINEVHKLGESTLVTDSSEESVFEFTEFREAYIEKKMQARELMSLSQISAKWEVASQVAHDIRSPLAALVMAEHEISQLPEDTRIIIRSAIGRIQDIANHLIEKNRIVPSKDGEGPLDRNEEGAPTLLLPLIDSILTEKRMQFRSRLGIEIEFQKVPDCYGLFSMVQPNQFKRVLSNLLNNAVEALSERGKVTLLLSQHGDRVLVSIRDTGSGIPDEILTKLARRGESYGKVGGSGLGLYHARQCCETWGGTLTLKSSLGVGTTVTIELPKAKPPAWFVENLKIEMQSVVVVLDDDQSIHQIWQNRFDTPSFLENKPYLIHLSTPAEFRTYVKENRMNRRICYLVDYELLGFIDTGLGLAEELNISQQTILVTSRYEDPKIRDRCLSLGISIIPKGMAAYVPIELIQDLKNSPVQADETVKGCDAVLLDDDPLVQLSWRIAARVAGIHLKGFTKLNDFWDAINSVSHTTPIYVDSNLGQGIVGQEVTRKLHNLGFTNLFLATGYDRESLESLPWLQDVIGKEAPWQENIENEFMSTQEEGAHI